MEDAEPNAYGVYVRRVINRSTTDIKRNIRRNRNLRYFSIVRTSIMEDKLKLREDIEKYDNPIIVVSGQGLMYLSVLLDAVITHRLAITNVSILKDCFIK